MAMRETRKLKYLCYILDEYRKPISAEKRNQNSDMLYDYYGASGAIDKIDGYTIDDHVMLIGEDGANLVFRNLPLMYEVNGKAWINNHAHILKPREDVDFYYLFYALENADIFPFVTGSAQPKLNQENLKLIPIPITNYETQKHIASFIKSKCKRIDSLITDIQSQIETLEEYKRSVITEAVTKGLDPDVEMRDSGVQWIGEIPTHWTLIRIGSLYGLRTQKVSDIDYPPLSVTKMGVLPQLDTVAKTNAHDDRKLVVKGDFVINSRSDRRGSCGISDYTGSVSLINTVLFPITEMNPRYYNWYFHTVGFADEFYRWGHGIVDDLWTTGWHDMKNILISVPPLDEQQRIADYLDSKCAEIDNIITEKKQQIETIEEYKKSLIFEYVTGKKEVV